MARIAIIGASIGGVPAAYEARALMPTRRTPTTRISMRWACAWPSPRWSKQRFRRAHRRRDT